MTGERREGEERDGAERAAGHLRGEPVAEHRPQPSPPVCRRVAKAVLHDRLVDGEVHQELEERERGEHDGEAAELGGGELAGRSHGREHSEHRSPVDARRGRKPPPLEPRAHQSGKV
jgi:hypothetical protein